MTAGIAMQTSPIDKQTASPPRTRSSLPYVAAMLALIAAASSAEPRAAKLADGAAIPHLDARGQAAYRQFLAAEPHRAFAIAPGGGWGWSQDAATPEMAQAQAQATCSEHAQQTCVPYAVDKRVVFDARAWPTRWRPYLSAAAAARAPTGTTRGERFPDLLLKAPDGKPWRLSGQRGKVVVLHFWGSWCPTCVHELPQFESLQRAFKGRNDIAFVYTQAGEPATTARQWLRQRKLALALHDSGVRDQRDHQFRLADGRVIADRAIAPVFPATYVLDRNGVVVFSLLGSARDWMEYEAFLRDLLAHK
jgi:thiol-disulfide isomerase/thioredoxin